MDKKSIFLALFIFLIIILAFYFTLNEVVVPNPERVEPEENLPEEELEEVSFTVYNDQENKRLELKSERVDNFKNRERMELRPVEAEVYSTETGELLYTLDSDFGIYYSQREYLELRDNVVVDSKVYHIESDELDYYLKKNYVEGRGTVKITGQDFRSAADSFNSDLNLRDLTLKKETENKRAEIIFNELLQDSKQKEPNNE